MPVLIVACLAVPVRADAGELPAEARVAIFLRAMAYDRNLPQRQGESLTIAILFNPADEPSRAEAEAIGQAIRELAINTRINRLPIVAYIEPWGGADALGELAERTGTDAVYLSSGLEGAMDAILAVTRSLGLMSMCAQKAQVRAGVSVGVVERSGRPSLVVNLTSSEAERLDFDTAMLRLAEIMR